MTFICTDSKMREMFEQWYVEYVRTAYAQDDEEMIENHVRTTLKMREAALGGERIND